jgi:hypothetical protein
MEVISFEVSRKNMFVYNHKQTKKINLTKHFSRSYVNPSKDVAKFKTYFSIANLRKDFVA